MMGRGPKILSHTFFNDKPQLYMNTAVPKNISRAKRELEASSFSIQQIIDPQEVVDKYLDSLSVDKKRIEGIVPLIIDIIEGLQDLTWHDTKPNEKTLKALNSLLDMARGTTQKLNNFKNIVLTSDFKAKAPIIQGLFIRDKIIFLPI